MPITSKNMGHFSIFECCMPKSVSETKKVNDAKKKGTVAPEEDNFEGVTTEKLNTEQASTVGNSMASVQNNQNGKQQNVTRPVPSSLDKKATESKTTNDFEEAQTPGPEPEAPKNFKRDRRTGVSAEAGKHA